uniref:Uncharacterized protein n=1 Tax=Tanacetum cinerariifolium TaxID=118510 RepID=A0A699HYN6_TANCI|nr:hypothetical protein [Tanacetum cinerariifolium]
MSLSRSSYDSLPSPTLPVRKRYRGTYELILSIDSEGDGEVKVSSDSDSESKDAEDEGPTMDDEYPAAGEEGLAAGEEGLAAGDEGPGMGVESHGLDDESHGLDDEGHSVESDGFGLGEEEEVVHEGQQRIVPVVGTVVSKPLGLGYRELRRRELELEGDHAYSTFETPPSPEWSSGSFPISPALSIVPSPISSPMMSQAVSLPIASPMVTSRATIPVDKDQFIEVGAQLELYWSILLGRVDTRMTNMTRAGYDDHRLVHDMLLQQTALQRELQEMRGRVTAWEQERDRKERGANGKVIDREWSRGILERAAVIKLET